VSGEPNSYEGKEIAVRRCENIFAVGDSLGMCRFTTKLFNSPNLPGYEEFSQQVANVTGLEFTVAELDEIGRHTTGIERLINHRLGLRKRDDTLPERWFEEPVEVGSYKGEKIDREDFAKLLDRFYRLTDLNDEGIPNPEWRRSLLDVVSGQALLVRVPSVLEVVPERVLVIEEPVSNVGELIAFLETRYPGISKELDSSVFNVAVNDNVLLKDRDITPLSSGDTVEFLPMFAGG